jgi:hypothetical protein
MVRIEVEQWGAVCPIVYTDNGESRYRILLERFDLAMEEEKLLQKPVSPSCLKCGEQPNFTISMLEPASGRIFHVFECKCGDKSWISEKAK